MCILSAYLSLVALSHCTVIDTSVALRRALYACCPSERNSPAFLLILSRAILDSTFLIAERNTSGRVFSARLALPGLFSAYRYPSFSSSIVSCVVKIELDMLASFVCRYSPPFLIRSPSTLSGPRAQWLLSLLAALSTSFF